VGLLSPEASEAALTSPAHERGVEWAPDALGAALDTAHGYSHVLQSIGKQVWDNARSGGHRLRWIVSNRVRRAQAMTEPFCQGRIVIVTGAGGGIGQSHAKLFAREGAYVVVNDVTGADTVVEAINDAGGVAVADSSDISTPAGARTLVDKAIETFGGVDVVVNNAGILRDRMVVSMTVEEWDAVMAVHLRGTFLMTNIAANHWRERSKQGLPNDARIINTTSHSGLRGNMGQSNYGAAKAGIAAFTLIASGELNRYGITVNAISPGARTNMTMGGAMGKMTFAEGEFDRNHPDNIAPVVVWLGSTASSHINGRVIAIAGGRIAVMEGWHDGPEQDKGARWEVSEVGAALIPLVDKASPVSVFQSRPRE
jgi:NAD(P)-dependent dehydrogenase (short-subunit alcohol dehydrogenase family)